MKKVRRSASLHRKKARQRIVPPNPITPSEIGDIVFEFLPVMGLMAWRTTSSEECQRATERLWQLAHDHCSEYARRKWSQLPADATGACAFAVYNKICVICRQRWAGGLHSDFAIPAHPACVLQCCVRASSLKGELPVEHLLETLPIFIPKSRYGYQVMYVWSNRHPAVAPCKTLENYEEAYADCIREYFQHKVEVRAERLQASKAAAAVRAAERRHLESSNHRAFVSAMAPRFKSYAAVTRELPDFTYKSVSRGDSDAVSRAQAFMQEKDELQVKVPPSLRNAVFGSKTISSWQRHARQCRTSTCAVYLSASVAHL
ncbi:hypothetical protein JKP88DRAFT_277036 [Tribonema minus]|uniref:Uncharacterized protein n=1 Tax=Tribonema minus TaxID=303371 RepID=A0A835Z7C0_9STRA|nr:hypothetical protein JKP88DRAFT_277036 [Tribonema minus]